MRVRSCVLALSLAVGAAVTSTDTARADAAEDAAAVAAVKWLETKTLPSGLVQSSEGFGDVSITLDAILSAAAAGHVGPVAGWVEAVEPVLAERVTFDVGVLGKALIALDAAGVDVTDFAGVDLRERAVDALAKGGESGWAAVEEVPEGANAFAQALVMIGLARTGDLPPVTVDFLTDKQCADGGFPMFFTAGEGCGDATSDPDGTALAIMALRAAQADCVTDAGAALDRATAWLTSQQQPSGAFLGAPPWTAIENTNSTGVVGGALARLNPALGDRAAAYVAAMQIPPGQAEAGAIAYDQTSLTADQSVAVWQNVRSTPQAILSLTRESYELIQMPGTASAGAPQPCARTLFGEVGLPAGQ